MKPFRQFPAAAARGIRFVLTDVDDTLTEGPRLPAAAYCAIEQLDEAGIVVIPITAAPAGWCDLIARMWPVGAVIGENGGLCFRRDPASGNTERHYWASQPERDGAQRRLAALADTIIVSVPGAELAHDQRYRELTLAFVNPDANRADEIKARLEAAGLRTTVNSLWVLGWFDDFDKLKMARRVMKELFATDIEHGAEHCLYVGDSPNDAPMFEFFPHSVGVASVRQYAGRIAALPRWITKGAGGAGFVEVAERLLADR